MTTVDFCPPSAGMQAPDATPAPAAAEFPCTACAETCGSAAELRMHCKSERHVYNTKRRLNNLKPISLEAWERKLREARGAGAAAAENKGTSHLKAKKASRKESGSNAGEAAQSEVSEAVAAKEEKEAWTPECCLFDKKAFASVDENLAYMWKTYNFCVPDREYCTDVPGLLTFLRQKISEPPHVCLFCDRPFPDLGSVRRHMFDKNHTRIGTEARSRRGNVNTARTEELRSELDNFYDYHGSTREITERIKDPKQKVGAIFRFFDADRDGYLGREELAKVWAAMTGADLAEAQYLGACGKAEAEPEQGLDEQALGVLYEEGLADLDSHFAVLQDLLMKKVLPGKGRDRGAEKEKGGEEGEEKEEEDEEDDEDGEEEEEDEDGMSSGTEIVECEDEDEFAEVMRILGMQPATLNENGDLRLPNGAVAGHRDVSYIWRQRGQRLGELAVSGGGKAMSRSPLMISNRAGGAGGYEMSRREQAREGKRIIAVLRQKNNSEMRLGIKKNTIQTAMGRTKIRTAYGDASGGR